MSGNTDMGEKQGDENSAAAFWLILSLAMLWRAVVAVKLNLSFDEGYYFTWALDPQLSYFDHPPLTAWAIYVSHLAFGETVWAVRFWPLAAGIGFVLAGRALAREMFGAAAANRAGIFLVLIPAFAGSGIFMTPDTLFALFWALALLFTWKALASGQVLSAWWLAAGLCTGIGFLSKYNMVLFFPAMGLLWLLSPGYRKRIFIGTFFCGVLSILVFTPVIVWNAENEWRSFLFQLHHGFAGKPSSVWKHFSAYLGALLLIATPLLGALALWNAFRNVFATDLRHKFCAIFSVLIAVFFGVSALKAHVEANWPMLTFFTGAILLAQDWQRYPMRLRKATVIVLAICCAVIGIYPLLPAQFPLAVAGNSFDAERMEEFIGAPELAARVEEARVKTGAEFVYTTDHQVMGRLAFYAPALRPLLCPSRGGRYRYPWIDCNKWTGHKALIISRSDLNIPSQLDFHANHQLEDIDIPYKKYLHEIFHVYVGEGFSPQRMLDSAPETN